MNLSAYRMSKNIKTLSMNIPALFPFYHPTYFQIAPRKMDAMDVE
jgi:hypothetical protein